MSNFSSRFKHSCFQALSWKRADNPDHASASLPAAGFSVSGRPFATFDWTKLVQDE